MRLLLSLYLARLYLRFELDFRFQLIILILEFCMTVIVALIMLLILILQRLRIVVFLKEQAPFVEKEIGNLLFS